MSEYSYQTNKVSVLLAGAGHELVYYQMQPPLLSDAVIPTVSSGLFRYCGTKSGGKARFSGKSAPNVTKKAGVIPALRLSSKVVSTVPLLLTAIPEG